MVKWVEIAQVISRTDGETNFLGLVKPSLPPGHRRLQQPQDYGAAQKQPLSPTGRRAMGVVILIAVRGECQTPALHVQLLTGEIT